MRRNKRRPEREASHYQTSDHDFSFSRCRSVAAGGCSTNLRTTSAAGSTARATGGRKADALVDRRGLATDERDRWRLAAEDAKKIEDVLQIHPVGVRRRSRDVRVGLDHVHRPRLAAARNGVDENRAIVPREQLVREVQPADAEVFHFDARGERLCLERAHDRRAEAVVPEKDVADARHQHAHTRRSVAAQRLDFLGIKEERAAVPLVQVAGGILIDGHGNVKVVLEILVNGHDGRVLFGKERIPRVRPPFGVQAHRRSFRHLRAFDEDAIERRHVDRGERVVPMACASPL